MTTIKVDTITNAAGSGAPNIPDGVTIGGTALASANTMDYTASATQPTSPKNGAIWWNTGNDKFFQYMNGSWIEVAYSNPPPPNLGDRALFAGGAYFSTFQDVEANTIDYVSIPTLGNATDFGDLTVARYFLGSCSDGITALFAGGQDRFFTSYNTIDYVTIATLGNALDFGDLTGTTTYSATFSDSTYGVFAGGSFGVSMQYVTIATAGNATTAGNLSASTSTYNGAAANQTYGLVAINGTTPYRIDYLTIATLGNSTSFGDFVSQSYVSPAACTDLTYALFALGNGLNTIEYVTIATPSNATDFGDLAVARSEFAASSNQTRGIFGGGANNGDLNNIDYVTIATPSNATDFGDLTLGRYGLTSTSGA